MKTILKSVLASVFILGLASFSFAQKMGHINLDTLISQMPESKKAKADVQDYYKKLEGELIAMQTEFQGKQQAYEKDVASMPPIMKQSKEKELQDLYQRIQDYQTNAQQEITKKSDALAKPIYEKANKAIAEVAKANGYRYVLDTSNGALLYKEDSDDVLPLVKKKLGI
jgi:outer membrane protein